MKVYCIFSDSRVYRSKSPTMFTRVMQRVGIKGAYVPFQVNPENVGQAMQSLRILNISGANVTIPYKETVIPYLDVLSEGANIIGAINTIVRNGDTLKGYNTNAIGFMDTLSESGFDAEEKSALVFGTGGAAKAVVFILNWLRTSTIFVAGRDEQRANEIVNRFGGEVVSLQDAAERPPPVNIVVNATSVSTQEEAPELAAMVANITLPECEIIVDLNYGRVQNFWQDLAERKGIKFVDGLAPLAYQARRTFALWTGLQVPPNEFLEALQPRDP